MNLDPDETLIRMRPHLPRYEESMARACFIEEADDVIAYIRCCLPCKDPDLAALAQRSFGIDMRNGWQSWLITLRTVPILWTDKPVPGIARLPPLQLSSQACPSPPPTEPKDSPLIAKRQDGDARTGYRPASK